MFRYQRLLRGFTLLFGSIGGIGNSCPVELVGCFPFALPTLGMESKWWICILASFFWSIMLCNSSGSGLVFSWVHLPAGKLLRRFDVVSSPTTAGNLLLPACCLPAAACLLLLPPAAVLLPPERGKGVSREGEQLQGRKASGHMLVGMNDVTPIKTGGMAVRTV